MKGRSGSASWISSPGGAPQVQQQTELPPGSEEEVEIRCCTVVAVEKLRAAIAQRVRAASATTSAAEDMVSPKVLHD
jgi:Potential Queuosine, Q, salvage protein family